MKVRRRKGISAAADLTPMIDVVFQLILFFLVSTTFAVLPAISVNLPQSETAQSESVAGITITAGAKGELFFNGESVTLKTLDSRLAGFDTEGKPREEYPVTLESDENVTNGTTVRIFDVLRRNGFVSVNLRTTD